MDRKNKLSRYRRSVLIPSSARTWILLIIPLILCVAVVVKATQLPPLVDQWEYSTWYVENFLVSSGLRLPTCSHVSAIGNYDTYWPKICTQIYEPGYAYVNVLATRTTGLNFIGEWRRYFLLTAVFKFIAGYLLGTLYIKKRPYRFLTASLIFLVPDYSSIYITESKGLSFPILLLGVYSTLAWKRGHRQMFALAVGCLILLSYFYFPRTILLAAVIVMFGVVVAVQRYDKFHTITTIAVTSAVIYLFQFRSVIRDIFKYDVLRVNEQLIGNTFSVALQNFLGSSEPAVPFLVSAPPYGAIALLPVAVASSLSCVRLFLIRRWSFFLDERMIWVYTIVATYVPVSLSVSFFWSRVFFEMSVPGILITVSQVERVINEGGHEKLVLNGVLILAVLMAAGNIATMPDPVVIPYEEHNYENLAHELTDRGIGPNAWIYTDIKTGAYLVGEHQYKRVYRIDSDRDRKGMVSVWYGTNATKACWSMKSHADVRYFILNKEVRKKGLSVENYQRQPIGNAAYNKFNHSSAFTKDFQTNGFVIYRLHCSERTKAPTDLNRSPAVPRYSHSTNTSVHTTP